MYNTSSCHSVFGYAPLVLIVCVKGNNDATASVIWQRRIHFATTAYSPKEVSVNSTINYPYNLRHLIKILNNVIPSKIYPTLTIEPGETKIIIECSLLYKHFTDPYYFTDGRLTSSVSPREAFGFYLLSNLPHMEEAYFQSVIIFTPKVGLFSETPPK